MRLTSNEKAFMGGLAAAMTTVIVQLHDSGQLTLREFLFSLGSYFVGHFMVWLTANTPKPPVSPVV